MAQFMPHGMCYLWQPELLWFHVISDAVIAVSYFAIPLALLYVYRQKRGDLPFHWMFLLFATFIVACGATHAMNVWNVWNPDYWVSGGVKAITAIASLGTAALLVPMLPRVVAMKNPEELERVNLELARREQQLAEAQAIARLGSWELDPVTRQAKLSAETRRILEWEEDEAFTVEDLLAAVHPDDRERVASTVQRAIDGETEGYEHDYRILTSDGIRIVQGRGYVDPVAGESHRIVGTLQDVTEARHRENEMRRREQQLVEAQEIAHLGSWEWDVETEQMEWSDELFRIHGLEPGSVELTFEERLERVHPEDRDRVARALSQALASGSSFEFEERVVRPDGAVRVLESKGFTMVDDAGRAVRLVGTSHDVTETRQAEEARYESELRYRAVFDQAFGFVAILSPEGVVRDVNRPPLQLGGLRRGDVVGRPFWETEWWSWSEQERGKLRLAVERAAVGEVVREECSYRAAGGEIRTLDRSIKPVRDAEARIRYLVVEGRDVTEVKRAERSVRLLAEAGEVLGASLDLGTILDRIAELVVEETATVCFLDLVEDGALERSGCAHAERDPRVVDALPRHVPDLDRREHPVVQVVTEGRSILVKRVDEEWIREVGVDDEHVALLRSIGFESFLSVPLVARDEILGAMTCTRTPAFGRRFTEDELRLFEELGRRVGVALENARLYEALRESEEEYRMLAEYASDLILRFTPAGEIIYASPAAEWMVGYRPDEVVGRHAAEFIHPNDLDQVSETHRALLHETGSRSVLFRMRRRDGDLSWVESTSRAVRESDGEGVRSIVTICRDVTENVQTARTVRLLERVAAVANQADTTREAMRRAIELVCEHAGWPVGHAYVPRREASGAAAPLHLWHIGDPERFAGLKSRAGALAMAAAEGVPGRVLETGEPLWVEDVTTDSRFEALEGLDDPGVRTVMAFPVESGGETLAVLEFFAVDREEPDEDLIDTMRHVGANLGEVVRRQRAEAARRASEQRFRALAESASDAIVTADEEGRIVHCNESVRRIFGYRVEELVGRPLTTLMSASSRSEHEARLERFREDRDPEVLAAPFEVAGVRKNGSEVPIELSLGWWEGDEGLFFTGVLRDITERKRVEKALNEKMEELARSNAELALFTYVASHDLREPLRTVGSNVQLVARRLGDEIEDANLRKSMDFALGGVRRMQNLIDDLLVYSRVGTEGKTFESVDLEEVVDETEASLEAMLEETGTRLIREGELPVVLADKSQLEQLFQNLFNNAIKYRREEVAPEIRVGAERVDGAWEFYVEDNGIGISPEFAEHVFTIFQRLHSEQEIPGTGIGLAVCRKIVERHGGRIWVESEPGEGSTFRFTLPVR